MKSLYIFLLIFMTLFSLVGCGEQTMQASTSEQSQANETLTEEKETYQIGDIVDFGDYKWRVLDIKDDRALLLTDEIIDLDYINITEETRNAIDSVISNHPQLYNALSDYEGWTILTDDKVFSEGNSFYDNWISLLKEYTDNKLREPYDLRKSVNWENCSLRNKLNTEMSFSEKEWEQIIETEVINPTGNGESTYDKVFLLSTEQVEHYFPRIEERGAKATSISDEMLLRCLKDFHVVGLLSGSLCDSILSLPNGGEFYWWAVEENSNDFLGVHIGVQEQLDSIAPAYSIAGVRPAIWISIKE